MSNVFSRQLGDLFFSAGSNLNIIPSGAYPGKQVVLRCIQVSWAPYAVDLPSLHGPLWAVELTTASGAQTAFLSLEPNIDHFIGSVSLEWQGHMALRADDQLSVVCNTLADPIAIGNVVASGYLLTLP